MEEKLQIGSLGLNIIYFRKASWTNEENINNNNNISKILVSICGKNLQTKQGYIHKYAVNKKGKLFFK